ncbi:MAG: YmdB family metallophosphoesterase [Candidatus Kerfeldbacteria bacterium]|nr:YmdB family metallophosphoesterase [Candidatus Kerfeldbacteria bacterium]
MRGRRESGIRNQESRRRAPKSETFRAILLGDVVGKIGRRAVAAVLPKLKRRFRPHLTIANAENLSHGLGVTKKALDEVRAAGVDVFTSGNNVWSKDGVQLLATDPTLLRPANYPAKAPGAGAVLTEVADTRVLIVNLQGRAFMKPTIEDPLTTFDAVLARYGPQRPHVVLVDMHAEATSEKQALAWYADGRASLVFGTHTHVQTADARILPQGTGLITDVGMCGARVSILGTAVDAVVEHQLTQLPLKHIIPERGAAIVNGLAVEINRRTGKTVRLTPIREEVRV